ncbi:MAG: hypothetical protein IT357_12310 [Gemmatimonadaceae bacterium]|nr:hypothetical protein [Gemmatimonadaceae bacterium]
MRIRAVCSDAALVVQLHRSGARVRGTPRAVFEGIALRRFDFMEAGQPVGVVWLTPHGGAQRFGDAARDD